MVIFITIDVGVVRELIGGSVSHNIATFELACYFLLRIKPILQETKKTGIKITITNLHPSTCGLS